MGIDFYLRWADQTEDERQAQYTGFATTGEAGYIREAYHGEPYATQVLCPEAFDDAAFGGPADLPEDTLAGCRIVAAEQPKDGAALFPGQPVIDTVELESRREPAMAAAIERGEKVYRDRKDGEDQAQEIAKFIDKAIELTQAGKIVVIYSSY